MTAALEARRLAFRYPGTSRDIFSALDLAIPEGRTTALLGANGCGKTTLLRLFLGIETPTAGELLLAGRDLRRWPRRERARQIGWVPQTEHVPFDFAVLDYVLLGRAPHLAPLAQPGPGDVAAARDALARVGLSALAARPVTRLSGGELQLASIARVLAQAPRVLLLDEPTSHLDLANRRAVQDVLAALARQGATLVFTTHDPQLAADSASRAVLMRSGQVLAAGPVAEVFTSANLSATYGIPVAAERRGSRWWIA